MSVKFKSNRAAVDKQFAQNKAATLESLGMKFTELSVEEMDRLIYHAPLPPSAGPKYKRTGLLRSGQLHKVDRQNNEVVVGNKVEYAPHVHFEGITRQWSGRPWMTNVINTKQAELQEVVETMLGHGFD